MVKTRTVVQTRTHAQKYFQKLQKLQASGGGEDGEVQMTPAPSDRSDSAGKVSARRKSSIKRQKVESTEDGRGPDGMNVDLSSMDPPRSPNTIYPMPAPSPAACGKRKHDELEAAQMLVRALLCYQVGF